MQIKTRSRVSDDTSQAAEIDKKLKSVFSYNFAHFVLNLPNGCLCQVPGRAVAGPETLRSLQSPPQQTSLPESSETRGGWWPPLPPGQTGLDQSQREQG